jgi:hypothetical protein
MHLEHGHGHGHIGVTKPPKVDRTKKPKSSTERLFGGSGTNATMERTSAGTTPGALMKSMLYDEHPTTSNADADHEDYYNNHHNVYRFTRSTVQPPITNGNAESSSTGSGGGPKAFNGKGYLTNSMEGRGSSGTNSKNGDIHHQHESNYSQYSKSDDLSHAGLPYPPINSAKILPSSHMANGNGNYGTNDIYNTAGKLYMGRNGGDAIMGVNGKGMYKDANDNPYKPIQPPQKSRNGQKPIPPPKPVKPMRTDLYGTATSATSNSNCSNANNSFYLNVPINLGNREQSAFELYRKEQRSTNIIGEPAQSAPTLSPYKLSP